MKIAHSVNTAISGVASTSAVFSRLDMGLCEARAIFGVASAREFAQRTHEARLPSREYGVPGETVSGRPGPT